MRTISTTAFDKPRVALKLLPRSAAQAVNNPLKRWTVENARSCTGKRGKMNKVRPALHRMLHLRRTTLCRPIWPPIIHYSSPKRYHFYNSSRQCLGAHGRGELCMKICSENIRKQWFVNNGSRWRRSISDRIFLIPRAGGLNSRLKNRDFSSTISHRRLFNLITTGGNFLQSQLSTERINIYPLLRSRSTHSRHIDIELLS
jgi:hypothetical protein